jgi:hypothetical protein
MHALVIATFMTVTLGEFLSSTTKGIGMLKLIPEMLSAVVTLLVVLLGVRRSFRLVAPKYWLVFGTLVVVIVAGILSNGEGSGPILQGARLYLRAIPMFILPAVYPFTDKQLRQQLRVLLVIGLVQVPIACYQRWVILDAGRFSGDDVYGTLMESGILSLVLIGMVLVLTGQFLRKRISTRLFVLLFFFLLVPTMLNETKITVFALPIGLLTTIVTAAPPGKRMRIFLGGVSLLVAFGAIFVPIYDAMNANSPWKEGRTLEDFFTDQKTMANYMEQKKGASLGMGRDVRRGDAITVPLQYLSKDPVQLAFGLGMGNASTSNLGQAFTGDYNGLFEKFMITAFSVFLIEVGVFGVSLIFLLYWLLYKDTLAVARTDPGLTGSIAAGWIGVVAITPLATLYQPLEAFTSVSYLFWFYSGLMAARRTQLTYAPQQSPANSPLPRATA